MRFYDIALFIVLINVSITIVQSTSLFPGMGTVQPTINVTNMASSINSTALVADQSATSTFFAWLFLPITAFNMFVSLVYQTLFGVTGLMYWAFQCSPATLTAATTCPSYVGTFIDIMSTIILIIYAIAVIQIIGSRYVESN